MVTPSTTPVYSGDPVAEISRFLAPELRAIEQILHEVIHADSPLIRAVGEYICLSTGKKLRPILTLLTARAFGAPAALPVQVAAAIEAIHVATLLHDDVIDGARLRRGKPTVNARWGDDVAILMADYLYAAAFELALHHLDPEPLRLICQVTRQMCEGEVFQIEHRDQYPSVDDYLRLISCKTAYLFSACGALGGLSAGLSGEALAGVSAFGLNFGLAFQITDDTLDYLAADNHWGKACGMDLAAGKQTLPLILALRDAAPEDRRQLEAVLGDGRDLQVIRAVLERYGCFDRSIETARGYAREALSQVQRLLVRDPAAYDYLRLLPDYVVQRRY